VVVVVGAGVAVVEASHEGGRDHVLKLHPQTPCKTCKSREATSENSRRPKRKKTRRRDKLPKAAFKSNKPKPY